MVEMKSELFNIDRLTENGYVLYHQQESGPDAPASCLDLLARFGENFFIQRLNRGEEFVIDIGQEELNEDGIVSIEYDSIPAPGQAYFYLVRFLDNMPIPFPLFELAWGNDLAQQGFVKHYASGSGMLDSGTACTQVELNAWASSNFGEQFQGLI